MMSTFKSYFSSPDAATGTRGGRLIGAYRLPEALLVTGFIGIGSVFAAPVRQLIGSMPFLFFSASYLLMLSVYAFNSWAGFDQDRSNPRLRSGWMVARRHFLIAAVVDLAVSVSIFFFFGLRFPALALLIFGMWAMYSWPHAGLKYKPLAGTALHIPIGIMQFMLGFWAFAADTPKALALGAYFGLVFASGHLNHELIDREADKKAGIRSGAVWFGERVMITLFVVLVVCSILMLMALHDRNWITLRQAILFGAAGCLQGVGLIVSLLLFENENRWLWNRFIYRCGYGLAAVGLILIGIHR